MHARAHFAADKGIADDRIADNGIADDDRRANDDPGGAGTGCAPLAADRRVLLSYALVPCMLQGWRVVRMRTLVRFIGAVCLMLR